MLGTARAMPSRPSRKGEPVKSETSQTAPVSSIQRPVFETT